MTKFTANYSLTFNEQIFNISIKKLRNAKRIKMKPNFKTRGANVTIPWFVTYKQAYTFIETNLTWLYNVINSHTLAPLSSLNNVNILGINYTLIKSNKTVKKPKIEIFSNSIVIYGANLTNNLSGLIIKSLKKVAKEYFSVTATNLCTSLEISYNKISIKDTKSRWGSCSSLKNLSFSWRLIFAPLFVANYIVCHEVAHLIHFNHSKEFWDLVNKICPDVKPAKKWLKQNALLLHRYV